MHLVILKVISYIIMAIYSKLNLKVPNDFEVHVNQPVNYQWLY